MLAFLSNSYAVCYGGGRMSDEDEVIDALESGEIDGTDLPEASKPILDFFEEEGKKIGIEGSLYGMIYLDCCNPIVIKVFKTPKYTLTSKIEYTFYPFPGPDRTLVVEDTNHDIETVANSREELTKRIHEEFIALYNKDPELIATDYEDIFTLEENDES